MKAPNRQAARGWNPRARATLAHGFPQLEPAGDGRDHLRGFTQNGKIDEKHAVDEASVHDGGSLDRQPRLARSAGAGQGQDAHILPHEQIRRLRKLALPSYERRTLAGEIARQAEALQPADLRLQRWLMSQPPA